ncbi:mucin-associated surface protein [Micromonospora orduensis]|uniref:Mucin-associated surface protein n=1 Tax=Micromonospora orduensis TaxID=1420891 RepID=A0A5C4QWD1_9ACTN|nr:mucin-associated surface protein [Micromonospora orduensis]
MGRRQAGRDRRSDRSGRAAGGGGWSFRAAARAAGGDRGSFTAELAAGLPALLLLLLAGLTAVNAVSTQASCLHAAREAALAAARGAGGGSSGPSGAEVSVTIDGERVRATVRAPVRTLGGRLGRITVSATAVAAMEPGAPEGVDSAPN